MTYFDEIKNEVLAGKKFSNEAAGWFSRMDADGYFYFLFQFRGGLNHKKI